MVDIFFLFLAHLWELGSQDMPDGGWHFLEELSGLEELLQIRWWHFSNLERRDCNVPKWLCPEDRHLRRI